MSDKLKEIREWAQEQRDLAQDLLRGFKPLPSVEDAVDTAEYHIGYREAMKVLIYMIDRMEGRNCERKALRS